MDDRPELREMMFAGAFYTVMIGIMVWQILRLLGKGGLDGSGLIKLVCSLVVLGIMCYVGYTMLAMWA
jgi:hypothetical protein